MAGGGALVATVEKDARPLSALTDEEMTDHVLSGVWTSVARLQEHRLGHRALRPEHVLVEPDGESRLSAFARAQLNAPPEVLGSDIAELLATTAVRIGPQRATACALAGLGPELLATALPYLQPLALMGPARREIARYDQARARAARQSARRRTLRAGGRPSLLSDLAVEVRTAVARRRFRSRIWLASRGRAPWAWRARSWFSTLCCRSWPTLLRLSTRCATRTGGGYSRCCPSPSSRRRSRPACSGAPSRTGCRSAPPTKYSSPVRS